MPARPGAAQPSRPQLIGQAMRKQVATWVRRASEAWPGQGNRISAQAHLQRFCGRQGFAVMGEGYIEDTFPQIEMCRAA